jgi:(2Fe-2S) ferredoxin
MVFPEYRWYHGVTEADVERIIQESCGNLASESSGAQRPEVGGQNRENDQRDRSP